MRPLFHHYLLHFLALTVAGLSPYSNDKGCSPKELMSCVVQMRAQHVPFTEHILDIVLNITNEAKLINTCKTFEGVEPCFSRAISSCGNASQRALLIEGRRVHAHLCPATALVRQRTLVNTSPCLTRILNAPRRNPNCDTSKSNFHRKLTACREKCKPKDAMCTMRVEMSQQDACTILTMERECGSQAAQFYAELQGAMLGREYPVQCQYKLPMGKESKKSTPTPVTSTTRRPQAPAYYPFSDTAHEMARSTTRSPSVRKSPPRRKMPIGELIDRGTKDQFNPEIRGKVKEFIEHLPEYQAQAKAVSARPVVTKVRSRMFSKMFAPSSGTVPVEPSTSTAIPRSIEIKQTTTVIPDPPQTSITTQTSPHTPPHQQRQLHAGTESATQLWLHGARPIPEASYTDLPSDYSSKSMEANYADSRSAEVLNSQSTEATIAEETTKTIRNDAPLLVPEGDAVLKLSARPQTAAPSPQKPQLVPVRENYQDSASTSKKWVPWYYATTIAPMPLNEGIVAKVATNSFNSHSIPPMPAVETRVFPVYAVQPPANPSLIQMVAEPIVDTYLPPATTFPPPTTTRLPFRVEVKWIDEPTSPAPQSYFPPPSASSFLPEYNRPHEHFTHLNQPPFEQESPLEVIRPLVNKLGVQSLNISDISRQANRYISAAVNAINSAKSDVAALRREMDTEDPWQSLLDTFERVSPNVMKNLREGIDQIGQHPHASTGAFHRRRISP